MPTLGIHLAITLFFLIAVLDKSRLKYLPIMMLFGIVSDLDVFVGMHRATFSNMFIAITPLIILAVGKVLKIEKIEKRQIYFCLACALLLFHISLDTFDGGIFAFYPVSNENVKLDFSLFLTQKELIKPAIEKNATETPEIPGQKKPEDLINITPTPAGPNMTTPVSTSVPRPTPLPTSVSTPTSTPTSGPSPTPTPAQPPETYYEIGVKAEYAKPGNVSEVKYGTVPEKEYPKAPIINNGIELMFLLMAVIAGFIKYSRRP